MRIHLDNGLGKHLQGKKELVKAVCKHSQIGLSFKPKLKHWGKKQKMVGFKVPEKTAMVLEYPNDLKSKETQDLIPPWATLEVSPENSCETTPLFIPPPKNFKLSINQNQVKVFCPTHNVPVHVSTFLPSSIFCLSLRMNSRYLKK